MRCQVDRGLRKISDLIQASKKKSKAYLYLQALAVLVMVYLAFRGYMNMQHNLNLLDITVDMRFLSLESGFGITQKWFEHHSHDSNFNVLWIGFVNTVVVSVCGIVLSTLVGVVIALAMHGKNPLIRGVGRLYVNVFRNVPLLVQILFWYNVWILKMPTVRNTRFVGVFAFNNRGVYLPEVNWTIWVFFVYFVVMVMVYVWLRHNQYETDEGKKVKKYDMIRPFGLTGLAVLIVFYLVSYLSGDMVMPNMGKFNVMGTHIYPEFIGLLAGLTFYTAAYNAESMRGAILAVSEGQQEASDVLGLTPWMSFTRVIVPQALPGLLPSLASHYMNLTKNSSLGLAVGYPEIFAIFAGTVLNQTGRSVEVIAIVMGVYLILSMAIIYGMNWVNQRQSKWKGVKQN
ncbi:MAG: ABC transporter permease subunit [Pseudomonadota bacterium]|nr:ABC transporter permease subunit [Pseudomonadota bacterium]